MTTTMTRLTILTMVLVVPGGLVALAAYLLARAIVRQMQLEQGPGSRRFARAVSAVRLRDIWNHALRLGSRQAAHPQAVRAS